MSKSKTSHTADRAGDLYGAARENPYVQRLIEDEDLRDNLKDAYNSAKKAYGARDRQRQEPGQGRHLRQEGAEGNAPGRRGAAGSA